MIAHIRKTVGGSINQNRIPQNWVGKASLSDDVYVLSYTPSEIFDFDVEEAFTYPFQINENKGIEEKKVKCLKVNWIIIKTPKLDSYEAEKFVLEKAQVVADYLGFLQNRYLLVDSLKLKSLEYDLTHEYPKGYSHLETNSSNVPQKVDLPMLERLNEDTISQLSNYNYSTQNNTHSRFIGSYKVLEIEGPIEKMTKSLRAILSHGKVTDPNAAGESQKIFNRLSFRPTHRTDRERLVGKALDLQKDAQKLLENKLSIEWTSNGKLYLLADEKDNSA